MSFDKKAIWYLGKSSKEIFILFLRKIIWHWKGPVVNLSLETYMVLDSFHLKCKKLTK